MHAKGNRRKRYVKTDKLKVIQINEKEGKEKEDDHLNTSFDCCSCYSTTEY